MVTRSRSIVLVIGVVLYGVACPAAFAAVTYTMQSLGVLSGTAWSRATDLNDHAQVVGYSQEMDAFIWDAAGGIRNLTDPSTGDDYFTGVGHRKQYAYAINNAGQVAGYETAADWYNHGYVWNAAGGFSDIGVLTVGSDIGTTTRSYGINSAGQVTGDCTVSGNFRPYRYDGAMHEVDWVNGSSHQYGSDINDYNVIAGSANNGNAYKWLADGTPVELGKGTARAINERDQVAGTIVTPVGATSRSRAGVWDPDGTIREFGILPISGQTQSHGNDINNRAQVVGHSRNSGTGLQNRPYAVLWDPNGTIHNLNDLVTNRDGRTLHDASGINEHGQICGYSSLNAYPGDDLQAFLLTPSNYRQAGAANVSIDLGIGQTGGAMVEFGEVTADGSFFADYGTADPAELAADYGPLPAEATGAGPLQLWQVDFTGGFAGEATVVLQYDGLSLPWAEQDLAVLHWDGAGWERLAGTVNPVANTIEFNTGGFSPIVLVPEPGSLLLVLGVGGMLILGALHRRRKR